VWGQGHNYKISALRKLRKDNFEFEASLGYRARPCLKKLNKARHQWLMPVILATWEAENRRISVQG
jgi:hypothetical protein